MLLNTANVTEVTDVTANDVRTTERPVGHVMTPKICRLLAANTVNLS